MRKSPTSTKREGTRAKIFTPRQTDTILAALRAYQDPGRCDVLVAASEIASEHGDPLSNSEIDALCEKINLGPEPQPEINPLFQSDEKLAILDNALSAAEEILRPLLAKSSASDVTAAFKQHVASHLGVEMLNLEEHGHVNDDPNDEPEQSTVYRALVELAQLVQEGNTEFDGLERRANEVLARIEK
jgi:hypothetical protein